jgi:hypothetical protein
MIRQTSPSSMPIPTAFAARLWVGSINAIAHDFRNLTAVTSIADHRRHEFKTPQGMFFRHPPM